MKKAVFIMGLVTALAIGCAVGTVAHNVTAPDAVAQAAPVGNRSCECVKIPSARHLLHCMCGGMDCLAMSAVDGGISCVPSR